MKGDTTVKVKEKNCAAGNEYSSLQLPKLLTYLEVADAFRVKPQTVRKWVSKKQIPFVKIGTKVRFKPEDIIEYIQAAREAPQIKLVASLEYRPEIIEALTKKAFC